MSVIGGFSITLLGRVTGYPDAIGSRTIADDSGAVPLKPIKMSLLSEISPLLLRAEDVA